MNLHIDEHHHPVFPRRYAQHRSPVKSCPASQPTTFSQVIWEFVMDATGEGGGGSAQGIFCTYPPKRRGKLRTSEILSALEEKDPGIAIPKRHTTQRGSQQ